MARIAVLGPLRVDGEADRLPPREQIVLAALTVRRGEVVSAEVLADAWWGERPPATWTKALQGCLVQLRKALGAGAIETRAQGYCLVVPADEIDACRFERHVIRAQELLTLGQPDRAAYVAGEGLALWRGRALAGLSEWQPGRVEAARLEELRLDAEELRLDAMLRMGRWREVLAEAQTGVAQEPLREHRWQLLALAQYQAGQQGDALRTLHRARRVLAEELGLDPGPDLVALEQAILRQDPSLVAAQLPEPSPICPYLGLVPYDVGDADAFFGRDAEVSECLRRLADTGPLAVVGPSGSGKSSLVRAGIAAALQRDGRTVVVVTPGARPADALTALPPSGRGAVLVVDQCEEAVTLCADAGEQTAFFAALAAHAARDPLVVALRADRLGELSAHPGFARLIEPGMYLLGAMGEANLRAAIEGPAGQAGLLLEPGLVELLVREVEGEPGALPLLSHALRTTWQRREGRTLTVAGYRHTGGIRGAVAQSAEELYDQVPPDQQPRLRDLLLRLVAPSPEGQPIRNRVPRRILATDPAHERLIELLVATRLITSDDGMVELAHAAVARAWPRLQSWLDDDVEGQRILRHLTVAADTWEAMERPDSELYRGVRLAQARDWRRRANPDLTHIEQAFLDASDTFAETEQRTAEARARHQARVNRRLRSLLAGVAVLLVAAVLAGVTAFRQRDRAQDSAAEAEASATVAEARRLGTQALTVDYLDLSLLLAVEGRRLHDSNDTRANLLAALNRSPQAIRVHSLQTRPQDLVVTGDGRHIVMPDNSGGIFFSDATTLEPVAEVVDPSTFVSAVAPVPHGSSIAAAIWSNDARRHTVRFFDPATGHETRDPLHISETQPITSMDISDDGRYLAIATQGDPHVGPAQETIWDLDAPTAPPRRLSHGLDTPGIAFTPDGHLVIAGAGIVPGAGLTVVDPATGDVLLTDSEAHGPVTVSRDGTTLVAVMGDTRDALGVFDLATGARRRMLAGHTAPVFDVALSRDGGSLASASDDRTVRLWDPATGERVAMLEGHGGAVHGVDFSADGSTLYSSSLDGAMIAWDLVGERRFLRQLAAPGRRPLCDVEFCLTNVEASPDGTRLSYYQLDDPLGDQFVVRDLPSLRFGAERSSGHRRTLWSAWTPDGRHLVTVGSDKTARLWDPPTGRQVAERRLPLDSTSGSIAWRPGGETIFLGLHAGGVVELDADTLAPAGQLRFDRYVSNVDVSPDDRLLAVALHYPPAVQLVDRDTGEVLGTLDGIDAGRRLDFSPDGSVLAAGGSDGNITLVDPATRRPISAPIKAADGPIMSLEFSPDGTRIVTTGTDGTMSLWDVATSERISRITLDTRNTAISDAWFAWFSDDGRTIVTADQFGGIVALSNEPDDWQRRACQIAGRSLTRDEWHELIPDRPYHRTCPQFPAGT